MGRVHDGEAFARLPLMGPPFLAGPSLLGMLRRAMYSSGGAALRILKWLTLNRRSILTPY